VPPGRIIAHQEELESHIFVVISGIASLTVKYLETNESYSGMLIYPGDAIGDANIKDKIVISKGRGQTKTYVSSVKECDVLVFERRQFTDVLFKDMMDSLYEKIMCMRNSEFFENLSPYAMVILCSNIELHEYAYGDVILRQECEPDECYIIISGECKLVLETVIYKPQEEPSAKKSSQVMKFGQQNYNPTERYGSAKSRSK
jgi:CRP-like cAMP-binding protein